MTDKQSGDKKSGGGIDPGVAVRLEELLEYAPGAVVSRTIKKGPAGTLTLFAFDEGQELSEHSAPFDAYVTVLDGHATLTIAGREVEVARGQTVLMPADIPHAVYAAGKFKMLLTMIKN